ncbi:MAG: hypothetical protein NTV86_02145 [Planctomycetota bacterium]|nr:hypothetical protein [Planctomycetota bacterium]
MSQTEIEKLVTDLAAMGRKDLIDRLHAVPCGFPLDFTEEFLASVSLHRLRHIVLAACLQQVRDPQAAH